MFRLIRSIPKIFAALLTSWSVWAYLALPAFAQAPDLGLNQVGGTIGLSTTDIRTTIARIISAFLGLLGLIAVVLILYGGFLWMTAAGNEETVTKAKNTLTQATIGLIIIVSAYAIVQFVFGAITGTGNVSGIPSLQNGCPAGQNCNFGSGGGGGPFSIRSTNPGGAGPGGTGWPKNYPIRIAFNAAPNAADVTGQRGSQNITVKKCNPLFSGGNPVPFDPTKCGAVVPGDLSVSGNTVIFTPSRNVPADQFPNDFEGDFWYYVSVQGGNAITDSLSRPLLCPIHVTDKEGNDWCERSVAFSQVRDTQDPRVAVHAPAQACQPYIHINATGTDDFLVAQIDFKIDGGTTGLVTNSNNAWIPASSAVNAAPYPNPFDAGSISIDPLAVSPGSHEITAIATDGAGKTATSTATFVITPPHCCNAVIDGGETGLNCGGGGCNACSGAHCTSNTQCASGYCDAASGTCLEKPIIEAAGQNADAVSPTSGGPGTTVTINGHNFGSTPGRVIFMGDVNSATDDKEASLCAPGAWTPTQIRVNVPAGAVSGPIKVVSAQGATLFDDTSEATRDWGNFVLDFDTTAAVKPGICSLDPDNGPGGTVFNIKGSGLGATQGASVVYMSGNALEVQPSGWATDGTKVTVKAAALNEGAQPVTVAVARASGSPITTNPVDFTIPPANAGEKPHIISISPESGPVGTYVTITGSGFGSAKGQVTFSRPNSTDSGQAEYPECSDNWHPGYITVKVPPTYGANGTALVAGVNKIQVRTANPATDSNSVDFTLNTQPLRPGIACISPVSGPPGQQVTVTGTGFAPEAHDKDAVVNADGSLNAAVSRYTVDFFKEPGLVCLAHAADATECPDSKKPGDRCANTANSICIPRSLYAVTYQSWSDNSIVTKVPGKIADAATWPKSGPVYVIAKNQISANSIPFTVSDCKKTGAPACESGTKCCDDGSCRDQCGVVNPVSAFGWRMSTGTIPVLPVVVESAICSQAASGQAALEQSPSPFKGQQDACRNADIFVQFNVPMDPSSFSVGGSSPTVVLEKCGADSSETSCAAPVPVAIALKATSTGTALKFGLPHAADSLDPNTWYRATLKSQLTGAKIVDAHTPNHRALDGNFDNVEGGDYQWQFKTRSSAEPCSLNYVSTVESRRTFSAQDETADFLANLHAANCNSISCGGNYDIAWSLAHNDRNGSNILDLAAPASGVCLDHDLAVTARQETPPNAPATLSAEVRPAGNASAAPKTGSSDLTVKFADPRVVSYAPNCAAACSNAEISATFNVDMRDVPGGAMTVTKCRNSSCNTPFLNDVPGGAKMHGARQVVFDRTGGLDADSFYLVRLDGARIGSTSGVALTGLDANSHFFSWKFKTRADGTACTPTRAELNPPEALLYFVGAKQDLFATPFSPPDACSSSGQALVASSYDWDWSIASPNNVLKGFKNGSNVMSFTDPAAHYLSPASDMIDTRSPPPVGCNSSCLLTGSQDVIPQCGNGIKEKGEECDDGNTANGDGCSSRCLLEGTTAPTCGNGVIDPGEACDKIAGVFPPGCKVPDPNDPHSRGCTLLGASAAYHSTCGDFVLGDGEACDDGNTANGDGCSSNCLFEGTSPSCGPYGSTTPPPPGCVNFCGNHIAERGEDPFCDPPNGPVPAVCDPHTCLLKGSDDPATCGDGIVEPQFGEQCDNGSDPVDHHSLNGPGTGCSSRCLLEGSSYKYASPSFCGDGVRGTGEAAQCEDAGAGGDGKIDPLQVVVAGGYTGSSQTPTAVERTSTVNATVAGIPSENVGKSNVQLSCTCNTLKSAVTGISDQQARDNFCGTITSQQAPACGNGGCCVSRPYVVDGSFKPGNSANVCRNTLVSVTFSEVMDQRSFPDSLQVAERVGGTGLTCRACSNDPSKLCAADADCGGAAGSCVARPDLQLADITVPGAKKPSFWKNLWNGLIEGVQSLFFSPAKAESGIADDQVATTGTFCLIPGSVSLVSGGGRSVASFAPKSALKPNTSYRVKVKDTALSALGARLGATPTGPGGDPVAVGAFIGHFKTSANLCRIGSVDVRIDGDSSAFFSSAADPNKTAVATARPVGRPNEELTPQPGYQFVWDWSLAPTSATPVVTFDQPDPAPAAGAPDIHASKFVRVRGEKASDLDVYNPVPAERTKQFSAKNGEATVSARATIVEEQSCGTDQDCRAYSCSAADICTDASGNEQLDANGNPVSCSAPADCGRFKCDQSAHLCKSASDASDYLKSGATGSAPATVLLCNNPWPARGYCDAQGAYALPWDPATKISCAPNSSVWRPFYDPETNLQLYYCRDGQSQGADSNDLPAFSANSPIKIRPGGNVFREYLFTFPGKSDAIGLRIEQNPKHKSIVDWYSEKFGGTATPTKIAGYDAVTVGKTAYVNGVGLGWRCSNAPYNYCLRNSDCGSGNVCGPSGKMYPNVYALSYVGDSPETATIYGQILRNLDLNASLKDDGYCHASNGDYAKRDPARQSCTSDEACRKDASGAIDPARAAYTCQASTGTCVNGTAPVYVDDSKVPCTADAQCWLGADGKVDPARQNYYCDARKSKLARDVQRWGDLLPLYDLLSLRAANQNAPTLAAGTFLRAVTSSAWPSWDKVLGQALGVSMPSDPVNKYNYCGPGFCSKPTVAGGSTHARCARDGDCASGAVNNGPCVPFDPQTCWNAAGNTYSCRKNSGVYGYQNTGTGNFDLTADLETRCDVFGSRTACEGTASPLAPNQSLCYWDFVTCRQKIADPSPWAGSTCFELSAADCANRPECRWNASGGGSCGFKAGNFLLGGATRAVADACTGTEIGATGTCGDGIKNGNEECDPGAGPLPPETCTDANGRTGVRALSCYPANDPKACTINHSAACQTGFCGDGVVQPPEQCDDGPLNGQYGKCSKTCTLNTAPRCGDGVKQPGEVCDCGNSNGSYKFDGSLKFSSPGDACPISGSCSWDCKDLGPRCGDGIVNGSEECDGGFEEAKGYCDASRKGCSTSADCPAKHCGGAGGSVCSADSDCQSGISCVSSPEICTGFCPRPEQKNRRSCNPNDPNSPQDNATACRWSDWSCTAPGFCGNGIKELGEECDDGNTDNTDGCIIDPAHNVMCKLARCGDGYVQAGSTEQCDDGVRNGTVCVPEYGRSCNYCTSACTVGTVSGGYCGDGIVQGPQSTPPGPEQCEGSGASSDYVCVSTKPAERSCGVAYPAKCSPNSCRWTCDDHPDTALCRNSGVNSDNALACNVPGLSFKPTLEPGVSPTITTCSNNICKSSVNPIYGQQTPLAITDACDPDNDNDGVPAPLDCDDHDPTVHPAYVVNGVTIVPAAPEVCGDGKDHDCNGVPNDNWSLAGTGTISGVVHDAMFVSKPIYPATVVLSPAICSGDGVTSCATDEQCQALGKGKCGFDDPARTMSVGTRPDGSYSFQNVSVGKGPNCGFKVTVSAGSNLPPLTGVAGLPAGSPLLMRDKGYWPAVKVESGGATSSLTMPDVFMMPVASHNQAIVTLKWQGALTGPPDALDVYLKEPAPMTSDPNNPFYLSYHDPGNTDLTRSPYSWLSCYRADGNLSCLDWFQTAPETSIFDWSNATKPATYQYFVDDYACALQDADHNPVPCARNAFVRDGETRVLVSTEHGLVSIPPPSNNGKYWHAFDLKIDSNGAAEALQIPNTISDTHP